MHNLILFNVSRFVVDLHYLPNRSWGGIDLEGEMGSSIDYYARRLEQARTLAERANDPAIRLAHLEMARRYQGIIDSGEVPDSRTLHRVVMDKFGT